MKKKTFKRILIALFLFTILLSAGIIYLNKVVLPIKVKSLIIQTLEKETQKKVTLESVQLNIFKGIVLKNLKLFDGQTQLIGLKELSSTFFILPIFKEKKIVIPYLKIVEPVILLERRPDGAFNISELLVKKNAPEKKFPFDILIYRISILDGQLELKDSKLSPAFAKTIDNINLSASLSLPNSIKFHLKSKIYTNSSFALINADGQFQIPNQHLTSRISINNLPVNKLSPYFEHLGIKINDWLLNSFINLTLKDNLLEANLSAKNKNIVVSKDKLLLKLNSDITANLKYWLKDRKLKYSGTAEVLGAEISGIETIGEIKNMNGKIQFNDLGLSSDKISAEIFGIPLTAKTAVNDFKNPQVSLEISSDLKLENAKQILQDKFKTVLPLEAAGTGTLSLNINAKALTKETPQINGSLKIQGATAKIAKLPLPLEDINGLFKFTLDKLNWSGLSFNYANTAYITEGQLTGFKYPSIDLNLSSKELSLESRFNIEDKLIRIHKLKGTYLNSKFLLTGNIDVSFDKNIEADINAKIDVNLKDLDNPLNKFREKIQQVKPEGIITAKVNLKGNLLDLKSAAIKANLTSGYLSLYGFKFNDLFLNYEQAMGLSDVQITHLSLYDGAIEAAAKINLNTQNLPFWLEANVQGVKLEKLKEDTSMKKDDIAGTIQAQTKTSGFLNDISKLSGGGKILISEGKLWRLNLLKGLGQLLFTKDFTNIVFDEGYCEFFIKDKFIFTDNLKLKSNVVNLQGAGKIGFDSSLDASINVEMSDEMAPETGTIKDITTALIGQAGRFAVIKLSGTLQKPKYKFQASVVDVIKGLQSGVIDSIFGQ